MSDEKIKKPFYKKWWVWLLGIVLIAIIANMGNDDEEKEPAPSPTTDVSQPQVSPGTQALQNTPTPKITATPKVEATKEPDIWIKAGMYKVGKDIVAGEYLLLSTSSLSAYYQVTKDSSGSLDSIISNDNFKGTRYVTMLNDQYIETKGAKLAPVEKASVQNPMDGKYTDGMYKVGRDIPAGEYKVVPDGSMSYVEVTKDSKGGIDSIISNDNFTAEKYVTIKEGQYIKLVGCYIKL